jgi:hypothetical protein
MASDREEDRERVQPSLPCDPSAEQRTDVRVIRFGCLILWILEALLEKWCGFPQVVHQPR